MYRNIGDAIQGWRERMGMRQQELADAAGLAQRTIGRYEHMESCPEPKYVRKIAKALYIDAEELLQYLKVENVRE